ncbi:MAG: beta-ketoacyl-ACP synthase II [Actinomycetota bacterium]|nr:beta-ketoacyl-ACP synthase II [Actinomycetota bacterium]
MGERRRRVVVTGMGAVTPLGVGARAVFERWSGGVCGIVDGAGCCTDFDPGTVLTKKEVRRSDRYTQLALAAAAEAVEQAGWDGEPPYPPERVGTVIGTGMGTIGTIQGQLEAWLQHGPPAAIPPRAVTRTLPQAGSIQIALRHGLRGPSSTVVSACAAGTHAIGTALRMIQDGDADACVTGGAEAALVTVTQEGFANMQAISELGIPRPFDARRDGLVLGEGSAMLVLEEAGAAAARGAEVLGEVGGYGATADAFHLTAPDPEGDGAARAIELALREAGVRPGDVDYVNAHGTATELNDRSETMALKRALGDAAQRVPVSSLKSAIGHSLGAAGAIEAVATLIALRERVAPPTLHWEERDEGLDLDYVPGRARPFEPRAAGEGRAVGLSNSFGFGGHNAVLCLVA